MTLHPIPLNFLIYEENFIFFFVSVQRALSVFLRKAIGYRSRRKSSYINNNWLRVTIS